MFRSRCRAFAFVVLMGVTGGAVAQTVTLGNLGLNNVEFGTAQVTVMDLNHPAQTVGQVTTATFTWSAAPCLAAATVKFFRPVFSGVQAGSFVMYAQRGPFDVTTKTQTVSLSPVVAVQVNDAVAITNATACGGPTGHQPGSGSGGYVSVPGDATQIALPVNRSSIDVLVFTSSASYLSLLSGRFHVDLQATDPRTGRVAIGYPIPASDRAGAFSLPAFTGDPTFPEVTVKMADVTLAPPPFGGDFWFFYSTLTDTTVSLTVLDTVIGSTKRYQCAPADPQHLCSAADTSAFVP
jgi:hypothetical protein